MTHGYAGSSAGSEPAQIFRFHANERFSGFSAEKNQEFTGDLKIVNMDKSDDYCIIEISLTTVKNQKSSLLEYIKFYGNNNLKNIVLENVLLYMNNIK